MCSWIGDKSKTNSHMIEPFLSLKLNTKCNIFLILKKMQSNWRPIQSNKVLLNPNSVIFETRLVSYIATFEANSVILETDQSFNKSYLRPQTCHSS